MELTTFAFNTVAIAFLIVALYDFFAPLYLSATNNAISPQEWAVAFADIEEIDNKSLEVSDHCIDPIDSHQPETKMKNSIKKTNRIKNPRAAFYLVEEFIKPAIVQSIEASEMAQDAIATLEAEEQRLSALADETIAKYPLL